MSKEFMDIEVKDIIENIEKQIENPKLKEILKMMCKVISREEVYMDVSIEEVSNNIEKLIRSHRHLQDGTVVEPL